MYCEQCGFQIMPRRPSCTRCGAIPTQEWMQFIGVAIILVAVIADSLIGWYLLPRALALHPSRLLFRSWMWAFVHFSSYGWIPLALALLSWDYFVWRKVKITRPMPKVRGWISRKMLSFVLAVGFAPILPWWIPAGQPSDHFMSFLASNAAIPSILSWSVVLLVTLLLCIRAETRNMILGRGRVLTLVSLGALILLISLTLVGWSAT